MWNKFRVSWLDQDSSLLELKGIVQNKVQIVCIALESSVDLQQGRGNVVNTKMELLSTSVAVAFSSCVCPLKRTRPEVPSFMVREFPYTGTEDNKVRVLSNSSCNQGINSVLRLGC